MGEIQRETGNGASRDERQDLAYRMYEHGMPIHIPIPKKIEPELWPGQAKIEEEAAELALQETVQQPETQED